MGPTHRSTSAATAPELLSARQPPTSQQHSRLFTAAITGHLVACSTAHPAGDTHSTGTGGARCKGHFQATMTQKYFQECWELKKSPYALFFPSACTRQSRAVYLSIKPCTQKGYSSQIPPSTTVLIIVIITELPSLSWVVLRKQWHSLCLEMVMFHRDMIQQERNGRGGWGGSRRTTVAAIGSLVPSRDYLDAPTE